MTEKNKRTIKKLIRHLFMLAVAFISLVPFYIMKIGFNQFRISYASAVAIYMTVLVMTIALILTGVLRKREELLIS